MQSPGTETLDFHSFFDLDHNISFSPLNSSINPPHLPEQHVPNPSLETNRNRTRNPRSCDFCRSRKTACIIESAPPCTTCRSRGKECVFTERPAKRRRVDVSDSVPSGAHAQLHDPSPVIPQHVSPSAIPAPARPESNRSAWANGAQAENGRWTTESPENDGARATTNMNGSVPQHVEELEESLDLQPTSTAFLLGETGEADPYLLRHPSLAAHAANIKFRQVQLDRDVSRSGEPEEHAERPLVFMMGEHSLYDKYEPRVEDAALDKIRKELDEISPEVGVRLVLLYFKHIYPCFPVLSRSRMMGQGSDLQNTVSSLPLSLKAALYASALPFMIYDDYLSTMLDVDPPSAQTLYRMAWTAITHEVHTPHLSTLQACLLLLQRDNGDQFVQCSPFQLSLVAWTVGLAQALALPTDCSNWRGIPAWEKRLRRRLWWATYVLDKWTLLTAGITSHIRDDDFDVLPLGAADFISDSDGASNAHSPRQNGDAPYELPHFSHLVQLTTILSDIHNTFFTIKASKATTSDLPRTFDLAKELQSRLHSWKETFDRFHTLQQNKPDPQNKLDGNVSLRLAYSAVTMLLFRALMRPLENLSGGVEDAEARESSRRVRLGATVCCAEIVEYLEQVKAGAWNAFWHKFSRSYFAIASAFMMRLLISSTSQDEINTLNTLVHRWRWAMRIGGGNSGSQLMSLGLLRLDRTLLKSGIQVSQDG